MSAFSRRWLLGSAAVGGATVAMGIPANADAESCRIVANGQAVSTVQWWASDRDGPAELAATELVAYVQRMTGAAPRVRRVTADGAGVALVRGADTDAVPSQVTALRRKLEGSATDSFVLHAETGAVVATGVGERAALYATYQLLGTLGTRFFAPNFGFYEGDAEIVPRTADLRVRAMHAMHSPSFVLRRKYVEEGESHQERNLLDLIEWLPKHKLNVLVIPYDYGGDGLTRYDRWRPVIEPELRRRGITVEVGGHGYESFLPERDYPRFYTSGTNVFDVHEEAALRQYVDNVLDYLGSRPEIRIFDAWPPDNAEWPKPALEKYGSPANVESHVVNTLAERIRLELPEVRVERIAYLDTIEPPDDGHEFAGDVIVDFAPIYRTYSTHLADPAARANAAAYATLKDWNSRFDGSLAMYEYLRRYKWRSMPVHPLDVMVRDVTTYGELRLDGIGLYSEPADWIPFELVHLLSADTAWDRSTAGEYVETYLRERFGAGATAMAKYFEHTAFDPDLLEEPGTPEQARGQYGRADAALVEAGQAVGSGPEAAVIDKLRRNLELARVDVDISYYAEQGDAEAERKAKQRYRQLVELRRFDGIMLQDDRVTSRYGSGSERSAITAMYRAPAWGSLSRETMTLAPGASGLLAVRAQDVDYAGHRLDWAARPSAPLRLSSEGGSLRVNGAGFQQATVTVAVDQGTRPGTYEVPFAFVVGDAEVGTTRLRVVVES